MSNTNLPIAIWNRRFVPCLFVVVVSLSAIGIFNPQCLGQENILLQQTLEQRLQQRCPHGEHRDRCRLCNVRTESFEKGRNVGRDIRRSVPPMSKAGAGKAGKAGAVAACLALALIFFTDNMQAIGLGFVIIVIILLVLGIISGYSEESSDETDANSKPASDNLPSESPELDFGLKISE